MKMKSRYISVRGIKKSTFTITEILTAHNKIILGMAYLGKPFKMTFLPDFLVVCVGGPNKARGP